MRPMSHIRYEGIRSGNVRPSAMPEGLDAGKLICPIAKGREPFFPELAARESGERERERERERGRPI
jgi:hypothetical protein